LEYLFGGERNDGSEKSWRPPARCEQLTVQPVLDVNNAPVLDVYNCNYAPVLDVNNATAAALSTGGELAPAPRGAGDVAHRRPVGGWGLDLQRFWAGRAGAQRDLPLACPAMRSCSSFHNATSRWPAQRCGAVPHCGGGPFLTLAAAAAGCSSLWRRSCSSLWRRAAWWRGGFVNAPTSPARRLRNFPPGRDAVRCAADRLRLALTAARVRLRRPRLCRAVTPPALRGYWH
jgi:hypothetical protein